MGSHDLVFQVATTADVDTVLRALDTQAGISGWWTGDVEFDGSHLRPAFGGMPAPFELSVARPADHRREWTVGSQPEFWLGTRCEWLVSAADDGSSIEMAHRGFDRANPLIGSFTMEWARILDHLVRFVETGVPDPRTPSHP